MPATIYQEAPVQTRTTLRRKSHPPTLPAVVVNSEAARLVPGSDNFVNQWAKRDEISIITEEREWDEYLSYKYGVERGQSGMD
jgi:hypothetical protein